MDIRKGKLLLDGRTKKVFATNRDDLVLLAFKNEATVGDRKEQAKGKNIGRHACAISSHIFRFLENYHIPTHFVDLPRPAEMAVRKLEMVPLTVWVWNAASGNLCKRYGFEKGKPFDVPIVEMYWKNPELHHPMILGDHAQQLGLAKPSVLQEFDRLARKINVVLRDFFTRRNLRLADFVLEFGLANDDIVLGDEISPETCQFWNVTDDGEVDISRFQIGKRDADDVFSELGERIEMR